MKRIARPDVFADVHLGDDVFELAIAEHAHVDVLYCDQLRGRSEDTEKGRRAPRRVH